MQENILLQVDTFFSSSTEILLRRSTFRSGSQTQGPTFRPSSFSKLCWWPFSKLPVGVSCVSSAMFVDKQGGEHGEELGLLLPSVIPLRARGKGVSRHAPTCVPPSSSHPHRARSETGDAVFAISTCLSSLSDVDRRPRCKLTILRIRFH